MASELPLVPARVARIITPPGMPVIAVGRGRVNDPGHREPLRMKPARPARLADLIDNLGAALPAGAADEDIVRLGRERSDDVTADVAGGARSCLGVICARSGVPF
jgi:hypothetical protein